MAEEPFGNQSSASGDELGLNLHLQVRDGTDSLSGGNDDDLVSGVEVEAGTDASHLREGSVDSLDSLFDGDGDDDELLVFGQAGADADADTDANANHITKGSTDPSSAAVSEQPAPAPPQPAANLASMLSFPMISLPVSLPVPDPSGASQRNDGHTSGDSVVSSTVHTPTTTSSAAATVSQPQGSLDDAALNAELEALLDAVPSQKVPQDQQEQPVNDETVDSKPKKATRRSKQPINAAPSPMILSPHDTQLPVSLIPGFRYAHSQTNRMEKLPRRADVNPEVLELLPWFLTLNRRYNIDAALKILELTPSEGKRLSAEIKAACKELEPLKGLVEGEHARSAHTKKMLVIGCHRMLTAGGMGERYFSRHSRTAATRRWFWPDDSTYLLSGFVMLTYRHCDNLRSTHLFYLRAKERMERESSNVSDMPSVSSHSGTSTPSPLLDMEDANDIVEISSEVFNQNRVSARAAPANLDHGSLQLTPPEGAVQGYTQHGPAIPVSRPEVIRVDDDPRPSQLDNICQGTQSAYTGSHVAQVPGTVPEMISKGGDPQLPVQRSITHAISQASSHLDSKNPQDNHLVHYALQTHQPNFAHMSEGPAAPQAEQQGELQASEAEYAASPGTSDLEALLKRAVGQTLGEAVSHNPEQGNIQGNQQAATNGGEVVEGVRIAYNNTQMAENNSALPHDGPPQVSHNSSPVIQKSQPLQGPSNNVHDWIERTESDDTPEASQNTSLAMISGSVGSAAPLNPIEIRADISPTPPTFFQTVAYEVTAKKHLKQTNQLPNPSRSPLSTVPVDANIMYSLYVKDRQDGADLCVPRSWCHRDAGTTQGAYVAIMEELRKAGHNPTMVILTPSGRMSIENQADWDKAVLQIYDVRRDVAIVEVEVHV